MSNDDPSSDPVPDPPPAEKVGSEEKFRAMLDHATGTVYLAASLDKLFAGHVDSTAVFNYFREVIASGAVSGPVEKMFLEQLTWAHHAVGRLHCKAAEAESPEIAVAYLTAIGRLMGEFRRSGMGLNELQKSRREPQVSKKGAKSVKKKRPPRVQKKEGSTVKLAGNRSSNGVPKCLADRMKAPTPNASKLVEITSGNGRA